MKATFLYFRSARIVNMCGHQSINIDIIGSCNTLCTLKERDFPVFQERLLSIWSSFCISLTVAIAPPSGQLPKPKHPVDVPCCNELLGEQVGRTPCSHLFNVHCLKRHRESRIREFPFSAVLCHMCRADFPQRPYSRA